MIEVKKPHIFLRKTDHRAVSGVINFHLYVDILSSVVKSDSSLALSPWHFCVLFGSGRNATKNERSNKNRLGGASSLLFFSADTSRTTNYRGTVSVIIILL